MPVTEDKAVHLIEIEAMRQIVDNLKRLNDRAEKQTDMLHGMNERLIRIESNKLDSTVETLKEKVDALEADRDRRDGLTHGLNWFLKSPVLGWLIGAAAMAWAIITTKGQG